MANRHAPTAPPWTTVLTAARVAEMEEPGLKINEEEEDDDDEEDELTALLQLAPSALHLAASQKVQPESNQRN